MWPAPGTHVRFLPETTEQDMGIFDNVISGLTALEASIAAINAKPLLVDAQPIPSRISLRTRLRSSPGKGGKRKRASSKKPAEARRSD